MATTATSSGASASSEPNTTSSTTSAPTAPTMVRLTTSLPGVWPPWAVSWSMPVTPTTVPGGSAACNAAAAVALGSPPWSPGNTSPKVVRPSAATNRRSPMLAYDTTRPLRSRATAPNARAKACLMPGVSTVVAGGRVMTGTVGCAWPPVP